MRFIVDKNSEAYRQLQDLRAKCQAANSLAVEIVKELGATEYTHAIGALAGGISGIIFDNPPDGWKKPDPKKHPKLYFPKKLKKNEELLERIYNLPRVEDQEFKDIIHFKALFARPGYEYVGDDILIIAKEEWVLDRVHFESKWELPDFLTEITVSQYLELKEKEKEVVS